MPNYTCLETVNRFHRDFRQPRLEPLDTVRLEIMYSNGQEWFASPGERTFHTTDPVEFVGSGMIANGTFAISLSNILGGATITWHGNESVTGREVVRYDFRVPSLLKPLTITLEGGKGTVGEEGSVWVDPKSLEIIRLKSQVTEIPPFLPLAEANTAVDFSRTQIGGRQVMLAQTATVYMRELSGHEGYDRFDFTHCQAFSAQSAIRFETEESDRKQAAPSDVATSRGVEAPSDAVPPFLPVVVKLATVITDHDAVGALIEATVSGDVRHKGKILIADGAHIRGRIRRLERYQESRDFIVGLEFTEADTVAGPARFYADFLRMDKHPLIRQDRSDRVLLPDARGQLESRRVEIVLPELPGVASFFVTGKQFAIPAGFRLFWRTRGLIR